MKPLSRFLRWHHAISAVFIVAMPLSFAWQVGAEAIWTVVGWSIAVAWTVSALVEVMALAADRWRRESTVQRSTRILSLILLAFSFAWIGWMMVNTANQWRFWMGPSLTSVVHTVVTGRFEHMAFVGSMVVVHWLSFLGSVLTVRTLWRRGAPGLAGRPTKLFIIVTSLLLGIFLSDGIGPMMYRLTFDGITSIDSSFFVVYQSPVLIALAPFLWFLNIRFSLSWLPRVTSVEAVRTILAAAATTLVPFVYGALYYGSTWSQTYRMKPWYTLTALLIPVVLWLWSLVFRSRTAKV